MTTRELLSELESRGIELATDGTRLRYRPMAAVDDALQATLRNHKDQLVAVLWERDRHAHSGDVVARGDAPNAASVDEHGLGSADCLWYIELVEHLAAVTAGPGESPARTDERIAEWMADYTDRQLRDGWTLTRCATDLRARIRAATKQAG